jgi:sarcosine oxidase subunit alpha
VIPQEAIADRGGAVRALRIRTVTDGSSATETIVCDAVLMSVGFAPASGLLAQSGATWQYDAALQQHLPVKLPPGIFAVGRVNGVYDYAAPPGMAAMRV